MNDDVLDAGVWLTFREPGVLRTGGLGGFTGRGGRQGVGDNSAGLVSLSLELRPE